MRCGKAMQEDDITHDHLWQILVLVSTLTLCDLQGLFHCHEVLNRLQLEMCVSRRKVAVGIVDRAHRVNCDVIGFDSISLGL